MALGKGIKRARWSRVLPEWRSLQEILEDKDRESVLAGFGLGKAFLAGYTGSVLPGFGLGKAILAGYRGQEGNEGYGGMPEDKGDSPVCRFP